MISVPQVMISSTFFDLKQVRADLICAIEELGCKPLSSELPSFPIDPDADTIENCRRRVERDADILVLIIGGRYGFVDSRSARSVTNIEYLVARAKGIPIYTFVERRISALLPIWKANREADFASAVDDRRVFEFIEEVREQHKVWMREFEVAEEIVTALRWEFAHLALQGAQLIKRAFNEREIEALNQLKGVPLKIALERPTSWTYALFAEVLIQEIESPKELAAQYRLGIAYGSFQYIDKSNLNQWLQSRMAELQFLILAGCGKRSFGRP
jgi:hypothetical protein